jgi:hypothetical protein
MAEFVFATNMSLDRFVDHTAFGPGPELFQHFITMTQGLTGSLFCRGLAAAAEMGGVALAVGGRAERCAAG